MSIRRVVAEIIIVSSPEAKYFRPIRKIYKNMQNKKSQNQEAKNVKEPRTRKIKQYDGGRSDHLEAKTRAKSPIGPSVITENVAGENPRKLGSQNAKDQRTRKP